jgi:hypothetical protein
MCSCIEFRGRSSIDALVGAGSGTISAQYRIRVRAVENQYQ